MKVYKVVHKSQYDQLTSMSDVFLQPEDVVVYTPGQWVSTKVGLLFAFGSIDEAVTTIAWHTEEIWLAKAVVSKQPMPKYILNPSALNEGKVKMFWDRVARGEPLFLDKAPMLPGTVLCKKIKLIKRMEVKDEN